MKNFGNNMLKIVTFCSCVVIFMVAWPVSSANAVATGVITANPSRCIIPIGQSICSSNITWSTAGTGQACVWINHGSGNYQKVFCGKNGSFPAGYISKNGATFELKKGSASSGQILSVVSVVGEKTPAFMGQPVKGANFFYLNGRDQEDLPQVIEKLAHGYTACHGNKPGLEERVDETLKKTKQAGVNWLRVLISSEFYSIYANRCGINVNNIYPVMSQHHVNDLVNLLGYLTAPEYNFNIELVLAGRNGFANIEGDKLFFESILLGLPAKNIKLVMLGGDVQPTRVAAHAVWISAIYNYFHNHSNSKLRNFAYSFDTVTYGSPAEMKSYVNWVKTNLPDIPVISINLYPPPSNLAPGATWQAYSAYFRESLDAYDEVGAYQPAWIDEYGFKLSTPGESPQYGAGDQLAYYAGFLAETRCYSGYLRGRQYPSFAWTIGLDRYLLNPSLDSSQTPYGLFSGYDSLNRPVVSQAWGIFKTYNNLVTGCP